MSQYIIYKRRCKRYVPTETPDEVLEFLKDRYRQGTGIALPTDPFCHCGLAREEHQSDAISNAPPDFKDRNLSILEPSGIMCNTVISNYYLIYFYCNKNVYIF